MQSGPTWPTLTAEIANDLLKRTRSAADELEAVSSEITKYPAGGIAAHRARVAAAHARDAASHIADTRAS